MSELDDRRLLRILGGEDGCGRLSEQFYARVAASDELRTLFPGKNLRCATEEFAAFLIQFLDGDPDRTYYRWWLSLRESHARFPISERQRAAWLRSMNEAVDSCICGPETRRALKEFFQSGSAYLVGRDETPIEHPELSERWHRQRTLDRLIDDIANHRDAEAIALCPPFVSRPSVLVGILARMMEAGREPLIEFVLESVRNDHAVIQARFNGRTLLHFAAGYSCLSVVRLLLHVGADPDVVDRGGHTPLYRTAAARRAEEGAAIVAELVRAGATVDRAGGVQRSTPLHEAARHGNVRIAQALLTAGACLDAKDGKGLTPHDRAVRCRRHEVAALLASR